MRNETMADVIAAMCRDEDEKVRAYAKRAEAANLADRFVLSVEAETVEASLRWLAAAVRKADGENRYGLSQLLGMAADKLHAIEHAHLNQGNVE